MASLSNNKVQDIDRDNKTNNDDENNTESNTNSTSRKILPKTNLEYGNKEYWDNRFAEEKHFEWLVSYNDVESQLKKYLLQEHTQPTNQDGKDTNKVKKILIVGCENSDFSSNLYDDVDYDLDQKYHIINIDYSEVVIETMKEKNKLLRPNMDWLVMDMTNMKDFENECFDFVIDKAAMDAIMTKEGDVWNPDQLVINQAFNMCKHISRTLKPGGIHVQISFAQPHFRKKYLLGLHPYVPTTEEESHPTTSENGAKKEDYSDAFQWSLNVETIDGKEGCFQNFLYVMVKESKL